VPVRSEGEGVILQALALVVALIVIIIGWGIGGWLVFWFANRVMAKQEKQENDEWWPWTDE
jgi:uncharacterized protein YneF (UPF0154 family)